MAGNGMDLDIDVANQSMGGGDDDADRLIFPINVHESLQASGGLKQSEKRGIVLSFWFVGCAMLAWLLVGWLRALIPNYYVLVIILIELVLQLTVGMFILRFVMDEGTMISEMENKDNSFAKYFGIYREHLATEESVYPFDTIEFSDGSYAVYIQFLMGYNTNTASAATYDVNRAIQSLINKSGMSHRIIFSNEVFSNSAAAEELRRVVAGVKDPRLFQAYRQIVLGLLKTANEESNAVGATYIIYAKTRIDKEELPKLVENILNTVAASDTAYREVTTMSYQDIVEFYRNTYKLDVLDMGLIRVHSAAKKTISCPVKVLKVYGKSGKVYTTPDFSKTTQNILAEYGLEPVNRK